MAESWQRVDPAELAALAGEPDRRRYFADHPELLRAELAWRLSEEVGRTLRTDLELARALCGVARWIAEELGEPVARARALRATANVLHFQRRYEDAARTYDEVLVVFEEAGAELEAAITRSSASGSLSHLARFDRALEYAAAARRTFERHDDRLHLGRLEVNVGLLMARQDRFPEAIEHFRAAYRILSEVGRPADVAITLRNIAVCYQDLNDFHASLAAYFEARAYCAEHGQVLVGLEVEYNIAYLYYLRGEYHEALRLFEQARRFSQEHEDRHHAALCDLDMAEIYLELNLVHEAEHLAEEAYAEFHRLGMEYETAKALAYRAIAAARQNEVGRGLELLHRSRLAFGRQKNRVWVAMVDFYKARILFSEARFEEAAVQADAAHSGFVDSGVPSRTAVCQILRARLAVGLGDLTAARRRCASALEHAREIGRPLIDFQAHLVAAQIEEAAGDPAAALAAYLLAHQALERMRGQLGSDELRIAFTDDKQAVYQGLVHVLLRRDPGAGELADAFRFVETAKSRSLADLLAVGSPGAASEAVADGRLSEELRELRRELNWLYHQISSAELSGGEPARRRLGELRVQTRRRERDLLRVLRRLRTSDTELSSLQGSTFVDLESLRAALPDDSCLIEYFIARGVLYCFILDRERLAVRRLGKVEIIRRLHRQLQFQLGKFAVGGDYLERFGRMFQGQVESLLSELHDALFGDWRPEPWVRHLIVVPHGFLHQVPFHALRNDERFLIESHSLSYAPSATVFQLCAGRKVDCEPRSLVLGVPDARAPRIRDEVETVARILPNSRLLMGPEASRDNLSRFGNGCRFVHIATHGLYRKDNPMFSAIQLGDTRLSLLDLYDVRLESELTVLSGCGTALSDVRGSDELVGLTRGLLYAGARSVMATLWDVNDESTAEFMRLFYGRLTEDPRPAAALRQAMLTLRDQHAHPYYWAPFVLTGWTGRP